MKSEMSVHFSLAEGGKWKSEEFPNLKGAPGRREERPGRQEGSASGEGLLKGSFIRHLASPTSSSRQPHPQVKTGESETRKTWRGPADPWLSKGPR